MSKGPVDKHAYLDDGLRVAHHHRQLLDDISHQESEATSDLTNAIESSEALLLSMGYSLPERPERQAKQAEQLRPVVPAKGWEEVLAEAKAAIPEHLDFSTLLSQSEIDIVLQQYSSIGSELDWLSSLSRFDVGLAIATGIIAGVMDVLLVGIPAHPGFLGGKPSEGGWLSNIMKEQTGKLFSQDTIAELERAYRVSYDPSTSRNLQEKIAGLGPRTHRFQSLGHDPLLGFIFGVRDILTGEFSAISKDGHLIVQQVADPFLQGDHLFVRIFGVLKTQFGHLASDVATPAGLPAPLMPLLLFLQFGKIGNQEYTIAEVARQMYRSGYDFRHFMANSIPVMITEVIIRAGYFVAAIQAGKTLAEAIPLDSSIKLRRQLMIAHTVATLINAGKVYITQNPLAISWAQILAFLRYLLPELAFLLYGKEATRSKMVQRKILEDYHTINSEVDAYIRIQDDFLLVV